MSLERSSQGEYRPRPLSASERHSLQGLEYQELTTNEAVFNKYLGEQESVVQTRLPYEQYYQEYVAMVQRSMKQHPDKGEQLIKKHYERKAKYEEMADNKFDNGGKRGELITRLLIYAVNELNLLTTSDPNWDIKMMRTNVLDDTFRQTDANLVLRYQNGEDHLEIAFGIDTACVEADSDPLKKKAGKILEDFRYGTLKRNSYYRSPFTNKWAYPQKEMAGLILAYDPETIKSLAATWNNLRYSKQQEFPFASDQELDRLVFTELNMATLLKKEIVAQLHTQLEYLDNADGLAPEVRQRLTRSLEISLQAAHELLVPAQVETQEKRATLEVAPVTLGRFRA